MPIVADRIVLPDGPLFHPQSFIDSRTAGFFNRPLDFASSPQPGVDSPPPVKILANPAERLKLLQKLAASGRLQPLPCIPPLREDWVRVFSPLPRMQLRIDSSWTPGRQTASSLLAAGGCTLWLPPLALQASFCSQAKCLSLQALTFETAFINLSLRLSKCCATCLLEP